VRIVVDESVPTAVADLLSGMGHEVTHVALGHRGASDDDVWRMVLATPALLVTRDHHFADPARYDSGTCLGIVYLRKGNLKIAQEVELVGGFFERHVPDKYRGRLVTLSPREMRIR
jgi:predicted nuclease of predicted toxin-antitoxin system